MPVIGELRGCPGPECADAATTGAAVVPVGHREGDGPADAFVLFVIEVVKQDSCAAPLQAETHDRLTGAGTRRPVERAQVIHTR